MTEEDIVRALVVYESMFGNTHLVADAIARGLASAADVVVVPVDQADEQLAQGCDLLVVGGPTHVHGMTRERTRGSAVDMAEKPDSGLVLDPDAEGEGLREWFESVGDGHGLAAAFDTRAHGPAILTGRASRGIARKLRRHGFEVVVEPESFLVSGKVTHLDAGEEQRAQDWGRSLARRLALEPTASTA